MRLYREAVGSHSPGSRSAPWEDHQSQQRVTPKALHPVPRATRMQPLRGKDGRGGVPLPRVRCATLGRLPTQQRVTPKALHHVQRATRMQPLRGKDGRVGCRFPGCAARPWAVRSNRFAVQTTPPVVIQRTGSYFAAGPKPQAASLLLAVLLGPLERLVDLNDGAVKVFERLFLLLVVAELVLGFLDVLVPAATRAAPHAAADTIRPSPPPEFRPCALAPTRPCDVP